MLNRQGKARLIKWFDNGIAPSERDQLVHDVHRLVLLRNLKHQLNFVEFRSHKLVYRRYAGLYFVSAVDMADNELAMLESLHFLVELLDTYFDSVCELDLVFNFYKLHAIMDEVFLGGEVHECSRQRILDRLQYLDKLD